MKGIRTTIRTLDKAIAEAVETHPYAPLFATMQLHLPPTSTPALTTCGDGPRQSAAIQGRTRRLSLS